MQQQKCASPLLLLLLLVTLPTLSPLCDESLTDWLDEELLDTDDWLDGDDDEWLLDCEDGSEMDDCEDSLTEDVSISSSPGQLVCAGQSALKSMLTVAVPPATDGLPRPSVNSPLPPIRQQFPTGSELDDDERLDDDDADDALLVVPGPVKLDDDDLLVSVDRLLRLLVDEDDDDDDGSQSIAMVTKPLKLVPGTDHASTHELLVRVALSTTS